RYIVTPGFLIVFCALFLSLPAPAVAHWNLSTSISGGPEGTPIGVAVDQSTGDVYLGNLTATLLIDEFDSSHVLVSPPSPFGSGSDRFSGIAVNPTNHDIYAVDAREQAVETYDPASGGLVSSFSIAGSANLSGAFTTVQIASDAAGNVYVPYAPSNEIQVFDAPGGAPSGVATPITGGSGEHALSEPTGVAVDPSGDVWVADAGNNRIEEFEANGTFMTEIASTGVRAVAVDGSGEVFASVCGGAGPRVVEYTTAGVQVEEFGLGVIGESELETPNTIAVDETRNIVYVADGGNSKAWAFVQAPEVSTGQASGVQQTTAVLHGHVDPVGNGNIVSCEFEYGTSMSYEKTVPCSQPLPYSGAMEVSAEPTGLSPSTTYHYRLVA